ncbi:MAG: efflux transporter outer membrane subunit [Burkholderiaceae bacterium]|nr:MAG: efflux transporter outer membrane subunit [Burkholderiaceae bacterium]TAM04336.1 MAG: efflux transporter outer membrane subunit [Pusillimonas sp.]
MKSILLPVLALLLTGCAAIDPGKASLTEIPGAQLGLTQEPIVWPHTQWWRRYHDTQLDHVMELALANNPSLSSAKARIDLANAAVRGAHAVQLPQLDLAYVQSRQRFSENYIYPPPFAGSMYTDSSLKLNVGFDLDLWGKNRAKYAAAVSRAKASQADLAVARNMLAGNVVQSYFNLQNALVQEKVLGDIAKQQANVLAITHDRVKAGLDTEVEVNQADSALSAVKVQLNQAGVNAQLLRHQLAALAGQGPDQGNTIVAVPLTRPPQGVPSTLPLNLLGRRPDIVAARAQVEAATSDVSSAKADFYPNINLSAFAGFVSLGLGNLLKDGSITYGAGPAITLPIFHGGALNAQLGGKKAERDLAIANYNQVLLNAVRDVADAATSIRSLRQQIKDQHASYVAIASAYGIAVKRYKSGLGNFVQVLQAQSEMQKQALLDVNLQARAYTLDAQLAVALGGGYDSAQPEKPHTQPVAAPLQAPGKPVAAPAAGLPLAATPTR